MLTKDILFGMNLLTLAGFVVMGLTLTLNRMGQTRKALSVGLMVAGPLWSSLGCTRGVGRGRATEPRRERPECPWPGSGSPPPGFHSTLQDPISRSETSQGFCGSSAF